MAAPAGRPRVDWSRTLVAAAVAPAAGPVLYSLALLVRYETSGDLSDGPTWAFLAYILGPVVSYGASWTAGLLAHLVLVKTGRSSAGAYVVAFLLAALPTWVALHTLGPDMPFATLSGGAGALAVVAGAVPVALLFRRISIGRGGA